MVKKIHKLDHDLKLKSRAHIKIVLMEPQKSENIGATARAIANMGLGGLSLVRPLEFDYTIISSMATSAGQKIVSQIKIFSTLKEALNNCHFVVGTTARLGAHRGDVYTPRQMAETLMDLPLKTKAAIVFGPERSGLTTADLRLCQKVVRIPTSEPAASSLNLAQAVLILAYELLLTAGTEPTNEPVIIPAKNKNLLRMYAHLENTLMNIRFLPMENSAHFLMNLKKIFNRSLLSDGECGLLRSICNHIEWAVLNNNQIEWQKHSED